MNLLAIPSSLSRSYSTFPLCSGDNLNWNSCIQKVSNHLLWSLFNCLIASYITISRSCLPCIGYNHWTAWFETGKGIVSDVKKRTKTNFFQRSSMEWQTLNSSCSTACRSKQNGGRMWFRPAIFIWRVCGHFSSLYDLKKVLLKS
jgi:hypothetical protein